MSEAAKVYPPTAHQRAVIEGTDRHLLVAAGAGSGKTETVINRLLYLLGVPVDGRTIAAPVRLDQLAAITFTIPAAAELKRKLRERLQAAGHAALAWKADTARIGTIHSFCGEVLREFALHQDTAPGVGVLEEGDAHALATESARDALVAAVRAGNPEIIGLLGRQGQGDVHTALLELLGHGDRLRAMAHAGDLPTDEAALVQVALDALLRLEEKFRDSGAMDFDRMLSWTRDLLATSPYALRTLQRRIHTLVIDEFQDVDPVQWEIARLLGDVGSGRTDTPRLLLVGDPKQSVYRFRGADVATWRSVERVFAEGHGTVVPLNENFRSTAPILDFVAATAGQMLDTPLDAAAGRQDYEIDFARLEVGQPDKNGSGPEVELIMVPEQDGKAESARLLEAEAIARRAVELHQKANVPWHQMALLFPTWSAAATYQDALQRHGVPTYLRRDRGFYDRREVMDMVLALGAVRDPHDDLALFGFLRSPFVGVRDETLLAIARSGPGPYWPRLAQVPCAERALLDRAVRLLQRAGSLRDRVPHDLLLAGLLEESGYWAHLALIGADRAQAIANVRKFLLVARGQAEGSLGDLLRNVAAEREREERVGDARLFGERDEVVTLTSIHSAKGLQWDVVFWCDLIRGPSNNRARVLLGRGRVALKDPTAEKQSEEWQALEAELKKEEAAEKARLAYVASTRAKRYLIASPFVAGKLSRDRGTASQVISELLSLGVEPRESVNYPKHGGGEWTARVTMADPAWLPDAVEPELRRVAGSAVDQVPVAAAAIERPEGPLLHSASEAMLLDKCEKKHWFQHVLGFREPELGASGPGFGSALVRGQVVHAVLERYEGDGDLDALIEVAVRENDLAAPNAESEEGRRYREELRHGIESVLRYPEYRAVADLPGARRELEFVWLGGAGTGWKGVLDLAARTAEGQVLLDVKTGSAAGGLDAAAERYRIQRDVYASAAEAIAGEPVSEFRFHFTGADRQVPHQFAAGELEGAEARLRDLTERMESGAAPMTATPRECEWCGFKKVGWCDGVAGAGDNLGMP